MNTTDPLLSLAIDAARMQAAAVHAGAEAAERHAAPLREAARIVVAQWEALPEAVLPDRLQAALFNLKAKL